MTTTHTITERRVWHGARANLRIVRVHVWTRAIGADFADRAWDAIAEAAGDCPPLAQDWDHGPHTAAFLAIADDGLADALRAALAAVAEAAGVDPEDIGGVSDGALTLPIGIHHFGDSQGGAVLLALDDHEALIVEGTQRLPD